MLLRLSLIVSLTTMFACGDDSSAPVDGGARDTNADLDGATDSGADTGSVDSGSVDSGGMDSGTADSGIGDTGTTDAGPVPDAGPGNYVAVAGARCEPHERIGLFNLVRGGLGYNVYGSLRDAPPPELGEPQEVAGGCAFYQANTAACECAGDLVCTHDRSDCVVDPENVDIEVLIDAAGESFALTTVDEGGGPRVSEGVDLPGDTFSFLVTGLGVSITTEETTVPPRIDVMDELNGTYDTPESVDLSWASEDTDALVYSLTRINHHVSQPTFTECAADASDGELTIPGSMLVPLSVSTGLEFQRVETIRFAAAELPQGCVEFRFSTQ